MAKAKAKTKSKDLVVVESPAKARTVGRFLGSDYEVVASVGHVRDLPKRKLGVDVDNDFEPSYVIADGKETVIKDIKKLVKGASTVYLATDPDREGEAISWHLVEALGLRDMKDVELRRVVFHEITKNAVQEAFADYRDIDMQLVNAQQARRVLDRIVGYKLSPVLWGKIRRGLSAGRVQSVALRLIVDREREIEAFNPVEYWSVLTRLAKAVDDTQKFRATLQAIDGKTGRHLVHNKEESDKVVADLEASAYTVSKVVKREVKSRPSAPFTTSTLQQEAARRLRFGAQRTMRAAQGLYEGIQLGSGDPVGLITYMRTDSTNLATSAVAEIGDFIKDKYGADYFGKPRVYRTRSKNAQEAHEAIRATSVLRTPESIATHLNADQRSLYDLIWKRMVASQMTDSISDATTVDIEATGGPSGTPYTLRATGSVIKFQGFRAVYVEAKDVTNESDDDEENESDTSRSLVPLDEGDVVNLDELKSEQKFTQPPARFSEAMLIRTLEENGIGRPSTFASIVATIESRDYVSRERARFQPTKLGFAVNDFLVEWFPDIMDTGFTAGMEEKLDEVARGDIDWVPMLKEFYGPFDGTVEGTKEKAERVPRSQLDEESDEVCEECERPMVIKTGRFGKFLSCSGFPDCKNSKPLRLTTGAKCPEDGGELLERKGRGPRGRKFYGCENYPECEFSTRQRPLKEPCPECGGLLVARGRNGAKCVTKEDYDGPAPEAAPDGESEEAVAKVEA
ncbi:MAG: type I DNA topoisomerase [Chloroflexi bacterium]|nr:type I DNA topoisomerase [Chloroflexota bacterium]MBT4515800.1 type I DNA topoisomerase [Chloroflexota bacterium]MBT5319595.1 type I DNA topoisomerase [Chloroflexota bacterium]